MDKEGSFPKRYRRLAAISFAAYAACYLGRSILSPVIPVMIRQDGFSPELLSLMGSAFFLFYGLGQLSGGYIGDRVKSRYLISGGLVIAAFAMAGVALAGDMRAGVALWALCGVGLSLLWGSLSKLVAENMDQRAGQACLTGLNIASVAGSFVAYPVASASALMGSWRYAFWISLTLMAGVALWWYVSLGRMERRGSIVNIRERRQSRIPWSALWQELRVNSIASVTGMGVVSGIVRNAVVFLVPSLIVDCMGLTPAAASAVSGILPVINVAGTLVGMRMLAVAKGNEHRAMALLGGVSVAAFMVMLLGLKYSYTAAIVGVCLASAAMGSVSNLIFAKYCLRFSATGHISTVSGLMNFTGYFAAAIANSVFAVLNGRIGWSGIVLIWAGVCALGTAASASASRALRRREAANTTAQ